MVAKVDLVWGLSTAEIYDWDKVNEWTRSLDRCEEHGHSDRPPSIRCGGAEDRDGEVAIHSLHGSSDVDVVQHQLISDAW